MSTAPFTVESSPGRTENIKSEFSTNQKNQILQASINHKRNQRGLTLLRMYESFRSMML